MVLLVRDPRDVVASSMDARRSDSWLAANRGRAGRETLRDRKPDRYVRKRAEVLVEQFGNAMKAYEAHRGPKALVRYEELHGDTFGTLRRMYSTLGVAVDEEVLRHAVEKHAWEGIPEELKGEGRFHRKATPGGVCNPGAWDSRRDDRPRLGPADRSPRSPPTPKLRPPRSGRSARPCPSSAPAPFRRTG